MGINPIVNHVDKDILNSNNSTHSIAVKKNQLDNIKGKVTDINSGLAITGVKIKWKGFENVVATTDTAGNFTITTTEENNSGILVFEKDGYDFLVISKSDNLIVKMKAVIIRLGGVSSISSNKEPLYIITSGKKSCVASADLRDNIDSDWIENVEVMQGAKATAIYGSKALNGVIIIGIKKEFSHHIKFSKNKLP